MKPPAQPQRTQSAQEFLNTWMANSSGPWCNSDLVNFAEAYAQSLKQAAAPAEENEEKMIADKRIWEFIELVARGNTEMLELEKLASNLIEEKYESEQTIDSVEEVMIAMDGNQWCATRKSFRNLMEDIAGFGDTPVQAIVNLVFNEGVELMAQNAR